MSITFSPVRNGNNFRLRAPAAVRGLIPLPKARAADNRVILIRRKSSSYTFEQLAVKRSARALKPAKAGYDSTIIADAPLPLKTVGAAPYLGIALVDTERLVGGLLQVPDLFRLPDALDFAFWAMNSRPKSVVIGLSGMIQPDKNAAAFSSERRGLVTDLAATYGRVIYNHLMEYGLQNGDLAINFATRRIHSLLVPTQFASF